MKRLLKILLWSLAFVAVLVVLLTGLFFGAIAWDSWFPGQSAADYANTQFSAADGVSLSAYLAQPAGDGPHPAVLLLHEWWGMNDDIVAKADALAAEGYVVLVPDLWRGTSTRSIPRAIWLVSTQPQERIAADVDAAFSHLAALEAADASRIAALGFCFGGGQSLQLGTRQPQLAATALFYGSLITDPAQLGALAEAAPVLGIFGADDFSIPPEQVRQFEQTLATQGIEHQITIYPGVNHGFANQDSAITTPGPAMDAWQETLDFLAANLKSG